MAVLYFAVLDYGVAEQRARAMAFSALALGNAALILSNRSQSRSVICNEEVY